MAAGLKIEGVPDAVAALRKVGSALSTERIQDCLIVGAQVIRDRAKQLVRYGPGQSSRFGRGKFAGQSFRVRLASERKHLRDLIFAAYGQSGDQANPSVIVGVDRKKAPHAHLVEFGHGGPHPAPPHPFLRPALDASKRDIPKLVQDMMRRTLQSFGIDTDQT